MRGHTQTRQPVPGVIPLLNVLNTPPPRRVLLVIHGTSRAASTHKLATRTMERRSAVPTAASSASAVSSTICSMMSAYR